MPDRFTDEQHGRRSTYQMGCRCSPCTEANAQYMRALRQGRNTTVVPLPRKKTEHGTRRCYNNGCRRPECVEANREYQREYMRLRRAGVQQSDPLVEAAMEGTRAESKVNKQGKALKRRRVGM